MFSFNEGIAGDLAFRLTPGAGQLLELDDFESVNEYNDMERVLPSKDVSETSLTDAYVQFILYCNPQFPLDVNTEQLRSKFDSAPRSDNKDFQTWKLFELIRRFNAKEIDTWGQLAIELGVEPPDLTKGQSIQKVQQYTVRLKRWMRAMHIDAFFEYLLGKQHDYYLDIPPLSNPYPATGRDGVPTEEDLAIRALEPSFRPKRGRRRNSDIEREEEGSKEPQQAGSITFEHEPGSAYPHNDVPATAHPSGAPRSMWDSSNAIHSRSFGHWIEPQSALTPARPMQWQGDVLPSPHPLSAMPGSSAAAQLEAAYADEPRSAVTPSTKKRRRHGPAVSSAWPSANPSGSKPRGRPPASRNVQDGPFTTFPVQNEIQEPISAMRRSADPARELSDATMSTDMPPPSIREGSASSRPGRLSLQVPEHTGAPVRLATPPRAFLEAARNDKYASVTNTPEPYRAASTTQESAGMFTFETLKRTLANDLLRADLLGRPSRLGGEEAKRLADTILDRLQVPRSDDKYDMKSHIARLTAASWLGLGDQLNIPLGPALGSKKTIRVTRFRRDAEGYEEVVPADDNSDVGLRQMFDMRWTSTQGTCQGAFELAGLSLADPQTIKSVEENIHDFVIKTITKEAKRVSGLEEIGDFAARAPMSYNRYAADMQREFRTGAENEGEAIDWKTKYKIVEFGATLGHGEFDRFKATMLQKVIDVFL